MDILLKPPQPPMGLFLIRYGNLANLFGLLIIQSFNSNTMLLLAMIKKTFLMISVVEQNGHTFLQQPCHNPEPYWDNCQVGLIF